MILNFTFFYYYITIVIYTIKKKHKKLPTLKNDINTRYKNFGNKKIIIKFIYFS